MVRMNKRKINRQSWVEENMQRALEGVMRKRTGYQKRVTCYHV